jgi:hypothetical protein
MAFTIMCLPPFFVAGKALRRRKELPRNIIRTLVKTLAVYLAAAVILPF